MSPRRDIPEADRALKALTRVLLTRCGGLDASAACVRVGRSQLANYTDMASDQFAPIDVIVALEEVAGEPIVTGEMARRAKHILVPLPSEGEGQLAQDMAQEVGETFAAYGAAMANDGQVDAVEAARVERELADLVRVASRALHTLRRARA